MKATLSGARGVLVRIIVFGFMLVTCMTVISASAGISEAASLPADGACAFPCREDFDDGDFDHATLSGLWHVSSGCTEAWSQPNYLAFNEDSTCVYPEGEKNVGEARLWVDLSQTTVAFLRFMDIHATEGGGKYDTTSVDASRDGVDRFTLMGPTHSRSLAWRRYALDLSAFAGEGDVIVRWRFDTVDRHFNGYIGWLIDDVSVDPFPSCRQSDNRANACSIPGFPYQNHQITTAYTEEELEVPACGVGRATAWFQYRHTGTAAVITVDTIGSTYDTVIGVYQGPAVVACNDQGYPVDVLRSSRHSTVSFAAVGGVTYHIQIGGFGVGTSPGAVGSLIVDVR